MRRRSREVDAEVAAAAQLVGKRVWLDAMICGKTFVASADSQQLQRLLANLQRDVRTYGREAILDMYRACYLDCKEMEHERFEAMDEVDREAFAWDVVVLNAFRSVLHDVSLTLYALKPAQAELQAPELVRAK